MSTFTNGGRGKSGKKRVGLMALLLVVMMGMMAGVWAQSVSCTAIPTAVFGQTTADFAANLSGCVGLAVDGSTELTGTASFTTPAQTVGAVGAPTPFDITFTGSGADAGTDVTGTMAIMAVTPFEVTLTGTLITAKFYGGGVSATIGTSASYSGTIPGGAVVVSTNASATFVSANAGGSTNPVSVNVTGYALDVTAGPGVEGDYKLVQPTGVTGIINPIQLTLSGITITDKTYDGTKDATIDITTAAIGASNGTIPVAEAGNLSVTGGTAEFTNTADAAGAAQGVTFTAPMAITITSPSVAGNYLQPIATELSPTTLTATIGKATIPAAATGWPVGPFTAIVGQQASTAKPAITATTLSHATMPGGADVTGTFTWDAAQLVTPGAADYTMTFTPTGTFATNFDNLQKTDVEITGEAENYSLDIDPATFDFDDLNVGYAVTVLEEQEFTFTNDGNMTLSNVIVDIVNAGDNTVNTSFEIDAPLAGLTGGALLVGDEATISIIPAVGLAADTYTARLRIQWVEDLPPAKSEYVLISVKVQPNPVGSITMTSSATGVVGFPLMLGGTVNAPTSGPHSGVTPSNTNIVWSGTGVAYDAVSSSYVFTPTGSAGSRTVTATVTNGTAIGTNYVQNFQIAVGTFVPVTSITGVPNAAVVGFSTTLTGVVVPNNASFRDITWSGDGVSGGVFTPTTAMIGTGATVIATITNGEANGTPYTQSFTINVSGSVAVASQVGTILAGTAGSATFAVTTTGFSQGPRDIEINGLAEVVGVTGPSTITLSTLGAGTLTLNADANAVATVASNLTLTMTEGAHSVTSSPFTLTINETGFVTVTGLAATPAMPAHSVVGREIDLSAITVAPAEATLKDITWSIVNAGGTGAEISGAVISGVEKTGTITVRARVVGGLGAGNDWVSTDRSITVHPEAAITVSFGGLTSPNFRVGQSIGGGVTVVFSLTAQQHSNPTVTGFADNAATINAVRSIIESALPKGMDVTVLRTNNVTMTGTLSGTPEESGEATIEISGELAAAHFTGTIEEPLAITSAESVPFEIQPGRIVPVTLNVEMQVDGDKWEPLRAPRAGDPVRALRLANKVEDVNFTVAATNGLFWGATLKGTSTVTTVGDVFETEKDYALMIRLEAEDHWAFTNSSFGRYTENSAVQGFKPTAAPGSELLQIMMSEYNHSEGGFITFRQNYGSDGVKQPVLAYAWRGYHTECVDNNANAVCTPLEVTVPGTAFSASSGTTVTLVEASRPNGINSVGNVKAGATASEVKFDLTLFTTMGEPTHGSAFTPRCWDFQATIDGVIGGDPFDIKLCLDERVVTATTTAKSIALTNNVVHADGRVFIPAAVGTAPFGALAIPHATEMRENETVVRRLLLVSGVGADPTSFTVEALTWSPSLGVDDFEPEPRPVFGHNTEYTATLTLKAARFWTFNTGIVDGTGKDEFASDVRFKVGANVGDTLRDDAGKVIQPGTNIFAFTGVTKRPIFVTRNNNDGEIDIAVTFDETTKLGLCDAMKDFTLDLGDVDFTKTGCGAGWVYNHGAGILDINLGSIATTPAREYFVTGTAGTGSENVQSVAFNSSGTGSAHVKWDATIKSEREVKTDADFISIVATNQFGTNGSLEITGGEISVKAGNIIKTNAIPVTVSGGTLSTGDGAGIVSVGPTATTAIVTVSGGSITANSSTPWPTTPAYSGIKGIAISTNPTRPVIVTGGTIVGDSVGIMTRVGTAGSAVRVSDGGTVTANRSTAIDVGSGNVTVEGTGTMVRALAGIGISTITGTVSVSDKAVVEAAGRYAIDLSDVGTGTSSVATMVTVNDATVRHLGATTATPGIDAAIRSNRTNGVVSLNLARIEGVASGSTSNLRGALVRSGGDVTVTRGTFGVAGDTAIAARTTIGTFQWRHVTINSATISSRAERGAVVAGSAVRLLTPAAEGVTFTNGTAAISAVGGSATSTIAGILADSVRVWPTVANASVSVANGTGTAIFARSGNSGASTPESQERGIRLYAGDENNVRVNVTSALGKAVHATATNAIVRIGAGVTVTGRTNEAGIALVDAVHRVHVYEKHGKNTLVQLVDGAHEATVAIRSTGATVTGNTASRVEVSAGRIIGQAGAIRSVGNVIIGDGAYGMVSGLYPLSAWMEGREDVVVSSAGTINIDHDNAIVLQNFNSSDAALNFAHTEFTAVVAHGKVNIVLVDTIMTRGSGTGVRSRTGDVDVLGGVVKSEAGTGIFADAGNVKVDAADADVTVTTNAQPSHGTAPEIVWNAAIVLETRGANIATQVLNGAHVTSTRATNGAPAIFSAKKTLESNNAGGSVIVNGEKTVVSSVSGTGIYLDAEEEGAVVRVIDGTVSTNASGETSAAAIAVQHTGDHADFVVVTGGLVIAENTETSSAAAIRMIACGQVRVTGGEVIFRGAGANSRGIYTFDGAVRLLGGQVLAEGATNTGVAVYTVTGDILVEGGKVEVINGTGIQTNGAQVIASGRDDHASVTVRLPAGWTTNDSSVVRATGENGVAIKTVRGVATTAAGLVYVGVATPTSTVGSRITVEAVRNAIEAEDSVFVYNSALISTTSGVGITARNVVIGNASTTTANRSIVSVAGTANVSGGEGTSTALNAAVSAPNVRLIGGWVRAGTDATPADRGEALYTARGIITPADVATGRILIQDEVTAYGMGSGIVNNNANILVVVGATEGFSAQTGRVYAGNASPGAIVSAGRVVINTNNASTTPAVQAGKNAIGINATNSMASAPRTLRLVSGLVFADTNSTAIRSAAGVVDSIFASTIRVPGGDDAVGIHSEATTVIFAGNANVNLDSAGTAIIAHSVAFTAGNANVRSRDVGVSASLVTIENGVTTRLSAVIDADVEVSGELQFPVQIVSSKGPYTMTIPTGKTVTVLSDGRFITAGNDASTFTSTTVIDTLFVEGSINTAAANARLTNTGRTVIRAGGDITFRTQDAASFTNHNGTLVLSTGSSLQGNVLNHNLADTDKSDFIMWADTFTTAPRANTIPNSRVIVPPVMRGIRIAGATSSAADVYRMVVDTVVYDYVSFEMFLDSNYQRHSHHATFKHVSGTLPAGLNRLPGTPAVDTTLIVDGRIYFTGSSVNGYDATRGRIRGVLTEVANGSPFVIRMENDAGFNDTSFRVNTRRIEPKATPHLRGVIGSSTSEKPTTELARWVPGSTTQTVTEISYTGKSILDTAVTDIITARNVLVARADNTGSTLATVDFLSRYHGLGQPTSRFVGAPGTNYAAQQRRPVDVGTYRMLSSFNQGVHFLNVDSNEPCTLGTFRIVPAQLVTLLGTLDYVRMLPEKVATPVRFPLPDVAEFGAAYSNISTTDNLNLLEGTPSIEDGELVFAVNNQSELGNTIVFDLTVNPGEAGNISTATGHSVTVRLTVRFVRPSEMVEEQPFVQIDFRLENIGDFKPGIRYTVNGNEIPDERFIDIDPTWLGTTIEVVALPTHELMNPSNPFLLAIPVRPAAPAIVAIDSSDYGATNGALVFASAAARQWRFLGETDNDWRNIGGARLDNLAPGTYEVRIPAPAGNTAFASYISVGVVETKVVPEATPTVSINFQNETLVGFNDDGREYTVDGNGVIETVSDVTSIAIATEWLDQTVEVIALARFDHTVDSDAQTLSIPARPATPTGIVADTTSATEKYGIITGVTAGMQYRLVGAASWTAITGTTVDSLDYGDYEVRYAATATAFASSSVTVTVEQKVSISDNNREIPGDREDDISIIIKGLSGEFTVGPNPVSKAAGSVGFFWAGKAIADGTLSVLDASGNLIANVSISDKSANSDRREIGSWNLTNLRNVTVDEGTFIVRGVVTMKDGTKQRVSSVFAVVR